MKYQNQNKQNKRRATGGAAILSAILGSEKALNFEFVVR